MISALGPHASFILLSYGAAIVLVGGLALWIIHDHRQQGRRLSAIDPRVLDPQPERDSTGQPLP
jgi:heme exporter protein D